MGSIVHRSVPTNLKWFPTCSHAHAMFQDGFKDVQVGSRWFSTLYILSPNFHKFLQEIRQVQEDKKSHPILERMLRTIQGDAAKQEATSSRERPYFTGDIDEPIPVIGMETTRECSWMALRLTSIVFRGQSPGSSRVVILHN